MNTLSRPGSAATPALAPLPSRRGPAPGGQAVPAAASTAVVGAVASATASPQTAPVTPATLSVELVGRERAVPNARGALMLYSMTAQASEPASTGGRLDLRA